MKKQYVYTPSGQILRQGIYDDQGSDPNTADDYYYCVHDRLGSVRLVLDNEGIVKNSYTYSPFGRT